MAALDLAATRIEAFHRLQMPADLRDHRLRRPHPRHALDAAGCGRALCARRQGRVSLLGADERDPGARRRRAAHRDVRARTGWRAEPAGAGRRAPRRCGGDLSDRRRPGDRGVGLSAPPASRRSIASSARATPMSPRQSGRCSAASASTRSPARRKSSCSPMPPTTRAASPSICWRRPSTTRRRRPS